MFLVAHDFGVVQAATLTLLGRITGFSFLMAISRYDLRKTYEEAEANAIDMEYIRAGWCPPGMQPGYCTEEKISRSRHFGLQNPQISAIFRD
jgi:hypothetical protein